MYDFILILYDSISLHNLTCENCPITPNGVKNIITKHT